MGDERDAARAAVRRDDRALDRPAGPAMKLARALASYAQPLDDAAVL